jgi:hypothetical protein
MRYVRSRRTLMRSDEMCTTALRSAVWVQWRIRSIFLWKGGRYFIVYIRSSFADIKCLSSFFLFLRAKNLCFCDSIMICKRRVLHARLNIHDVHIFHSNHFETVFFLRPRGVLSRNTLPPKFVRRCSRTLKTLACEKRYL